jgi:hypothetical protein
MERFRLKGTESHRRQRISKRSNGGNGSTFDGLGIRRGARRPDGRLAGGEELAEHTSTVDL